MLEQLEWLHTALAENPSTSLVAVDSMTAWQSMAAAFPCSVGAVVRDCWCALARLQREHCIAVVVTHRDSGVSGLEQKVAVAEVGECCHLNVERERRAHVGPAIEMFAVVAWCKTLKARVSLPFSFSHAGAVVDGAG